jgi:hypothetical protein
MLAWPQSTRKSGSQKSVNRNLKGFLEQDSLDLD